ncbi:plasmid pRiA4b ORF-3 family protein [Bacillus canaveralius]|nr:plasmid pRiA4b ORF-3 family protein [Bacillus canaveralius]
MSKFEGEIGEIKKFLLTTVKAEVAELLDYQIKNIRTGTKKQKSSVRKAKPIMTYQLKVSLKGIRPPIWRRIEVHSELTFHQLHEVIQVLMGWENYHLYSFEYNDVLIELPEDELETGFFLPKMRETADSRKEKLGDWIRAEKDKFLYTYDFGDDWEHMVTVEKIEQVSEKLKYPVCLKGKRACPPEDVGGIYGYSALLQAFQDQGDRQLDQEEKEYMEELREWYGPIDPEAFDIDQVNQSLKKVLTNRKR